MPAYLALYAGQPLRLAGTAAAAAIGLGIYRPPVSPAHPRSAAGASSSWSRPRAGGHGFRDGCSRPSCPKPRGGGPWG
ncbi:MAG: hypothetical protein M0C28_25460 [Candidatus Moduliflexus flocculans]|nr:hypothetical protein [Candidatus Moduliflexus flocculans]